MSGKAGALEKAGKAKDIDTIKKLLPVFCDDLKAMAAEIRSALHPVASDVIVKTGEDQEKFKSQLAALKRFLETDNISAADRVMTGLIEMSPPDEKTGESLAAVSDLMLLAESGEAIAIIDLLLSV